MPECYRETLGSSPGSPTCLSLLIFFESHLLALPANQVILFSSSVSNQVDDYNYSYCYGKNEMLQVTKWKPRAMDHEGIWSQAGSHMTDESHSAGVRKREMHHEVKVGIYLVVY